MKRTILHLTICAFIAYSYPVFATRYHVNINNGDDANDGLKWSTAFKNLQTAIDAAEEKDEIWIAAGIYHPTKKIGNVYGSPNNPTRPTTDRHRSFIIKKNIALYGGFSRSPSDATTMTSRNWQLYQTILSGDFDENDGDNFENMDENAYHVVILFDASPSLVMDGFYITGGCSNDIANSYLDGNRYYYAAGGYGGGLYAYSPVDVSSPTLSNISFYGNFADYGGGLFIHAYANDASPYMMNVSIVHNKADYGLGGGLSIEGSSINAQLHNLNVVGNESYESGGGIYLISIEDCTPTIVNTVVSGNYSHTGNGAGVFIRTRSGDAKPTIVNSTVCGNKTPKDGGGFVVYTEGISETNVYNSVFWGNSGNGFDNFYAFGEYGSYNTIEGSFIEGVNNLGETNLPGNIDPKFLEPVRADLAPTMDGDYQLTLESPLINKGINTHVLSSIDLLGNSRTVGGTVDIGAYESQGTPPVFNETVEEEKLIWSSNGFLYVQVDLSAALHVYTLDGSLVKHINHLDAGVYQYALPRGFYVVTLSNGISEKVVIR